MVVSNADQQNDLAATRRVVARDELAEAGLGPAPAVARTFSPTGLGRSKIDLVDLDETLAFQLRACHKDGAWGGRNELDTQGLTQSPDRPIGATGGWILDARGRRHRRRNGRCGLEGMCGGGPGLTVNSRRPA